MMMITAKDYMPVLKWRQGEYQALWRLSDVHKDHVVPLIKITPPDFELWQPKKTIDEHLLRFRQRLKEKWGVRLALLDAGLLDPAMRMTGGEHPLTWLLDQVRADGAVLIPVTGFDRDTSYQAAVRAGHTLDGHGAALRCGIEDAADPDFLGNIETLLETIGVEIAELDIVIDLKAPNFELIDGLAQLLVNVLIASDAFFWARSVTIVATAFPASMAEVKGPLQFISRREWLLYKALIPLVPASMQRPAFGDYAIAAPDLLQGDMRLLKKGLCG